MSDALAYVEEQVEKFSLAEQIQLLNFIANNINKKTSILINEYSEEESFEEMEPSDEEILEGDDK